jgi:hypothetical protein
MGFPNKEQKLSAFTFGTESIAALTLYFDFPGSVAAPAQVISVERVYRRLTRQL